MNVEVSLVLQLPFVSRTLKNVFVWIFRGAAGCKWGKVDGSSLRRWGGLILWSSQH